MLRTVMPWTLMGVFLGATNLYAEQEVGNGGDIVYCENNGEPTYEVLDHWEGRAYFGFDSILDELPGGYMERATFVIDRLKSHFPSEGEYLATQLREFENNARFVEDMELVLIPDAYPRVLPKGCVLKQIANQREPRFPGERVFVIDHQLWEKLDAGNQAALVLHELIYRYALRVSHHSNSIRARYLVGYISQLSYDTLPEHLRIFASRVVFDQDRGDVKTSCFEKGFFWFQDFPILCTNADVSFYPTGNVSFGMVLITNQLNPLIGNLEQSDETSKGRSIRASFSKTGKLTSVTPTKFGFLRAKVAGDRVVKLGGHIGSLHEAYFHEDSRRSLKHGMLTNTHRLLTTAGDEREFNAFDELSFDENGFVIVD